MTHIFISYSKKDVEFAQYLRSLLQDKGFAVWMDETKLMSHEPWWKIIEQNIINCAAFIVIMSPNSQDSKWVEREVIAAEDQEKPIFPILLAGRGWYRLGNIQYENMTAGINSALTTGFVDGLQKFAPSFTGQPAPPVLATNLSTEQFPTVNAQLGGGRAKKLKIGLATLLVLITMIAAVIVIMLRGNSEVESTPSPNLSPSHQVAVVLNVQTETPLNPRTQVWLEIRETEVSLGSTSTIAQTRTEVASTLTSNAIPLGFSGFPVTTNAEWQSYISEYIQNIHGIEMVLVPTGCFRMGNDSHTYDSDQFGVGDGGEQCFNNPFYISRYEITSTQFNQFDCMVEQSSINTFNYPRGDVTWIEAYECAKKIGMRLPTEAEWEYAARGPDELIYPWDDEFLIDSTVYSENSNLHVAEVGSRPDGVSWIGAYDMSGNIWEWTSSIYSPYPYFIDDGRESDADNTSPRTIRGGSFVNNENDVRSTIRYRRVPNYRNVAIGFRLVADVNLIRE